MDGEGIMHRSYSCFPELESEHEVLVIIFSVWAYSVLSSVGKTSTEAALIAILSTQA